MLENTGVLFRKPLGVTWRIAGTRRLSNCSRLGRKRVAGRSRAVGEGTARKSRSQDASRMRKLLTSETSAIVREEEATRGRILPLGCGRADENDTGRSYGKRR